MLDTELLQARIKEQRETRDFYLKSFTALLCRGEGIPIEGKEFTERYEGLCSEGFLKKLSIGEMPTAQEFTAEETEGLDQVVQDMVMLKGLSAGVTQVMGCEVDGGDSYIAEIQEWYKSVNTLPYLIAFAALTLSCGLYPSRLLLKTVVSPLNGDVEHDEKVKAILGELNQTVVIGLLKMLELEEEQ